MFLAGSGMPAVAVAAAAAAVVVTAVGVPAGVPAVEVTAPQLVEAERVVEKAVSGAMAVLAT